MKRTSRKLSPAIFREAARLLMEDESVVFACTALERTTGLQYGSPEKEAFVRLLKPKEASGWCAWYSRSTYCGRNQHDYHYDEETARVLGLLLCELLAKEGVLADE